LNFIVVILDIFKKIHLNMVQAKALKVKESGVKKPKKTLAGQKPKGKAFFKGLTSESEYQGEDYEVFTSWLGQGQGQE
jgi:hypothetical protein